MDSAELAAREAIRDLVATYTAYGDRGRFAEFCALFGGDGTLDLGDGRVFCGRESIQAFLEATRASLAAGGERPFIRHHVSSLRIVVDGADAARGDCYFLAVTHHGPDHWGRYRDRYVREQGRWRFAERRVRVEGMAPGSWAAARRASQGGGSGPEGRGPS